jgi:Cu2+-exporting ATPase
MENEQHNHSDHDNGKMIQKKNDHNEHNHSEHHGHMIEDFKKKNLILFPVKVRKVK